MILTIVALGSRGDVYPSIALGLGFKRAGFQVRMAVNTLFESEIVTQGLEFLPINTLYRESMAVSPDSLSPLSSLDPIRFLTLKKSRISPVVDRIVTDIQHACQDADIILYNMLALPAYYFAKQMNIRAYPICLQPLYRTNAFPSPVVTSSMYVPRLLNSASYRLVEKGMDYFLTNSSQLKGKASIRDCLKEISSGNIPVLNGFSSCIQPKPADWSRNMHITGYWFLDESEEWVPPPELKAFLENGPAPICIGFGSMNDPDIKQIIETTVKGALNAGYRVVLLTGWSGESFSDRICPDLFVTGDIPHSWLFPRVSVVVHHGGAGTTAAAVRAGIPSVIIPFFFDQCFWADRLVKLGAGLPFIPKKALTPDHLGAVLANTTGSKEISDQLQNLRRHVQKENGVENAVNLLLKEIDQPIMPRLMPL